MSPNASIKQAAGDPSYPFAEMIWQGRVQLGDEPGVYGDANYSGLSIEFPFNIEVSATETGVGTILIGVEAENVHVFAPYPGHSVKIIYHYPDDPANQNGTWGQKILADGRLTTDTVQVPVDLTGITESLIFMSLRIEVDTTVRAGLYNDFVFTRLVKYGKDFKYSTSFGFMAPR